MKKFIHTILIFLSLTLITKGENLSSHYHEILDLYNQGEYKSVLDTYYNSPPRNTSINEASALFSVIVKSHAHLGEYEEAMKYIETTNKNSSIQIPQGYISLYKATLNIIFNKDREAKKILHEVINNKSIITPDSILAKVYHNLALCYENEQRFSLALHYFKLSYNLEKKLLPKKDNYKNLNISAGAIIQTLCTHLKDFEAAESYYNEVLSYPFNQKINPDNAFLYSILLDYYLKTENQRKYEILTRKLEDYYLEQFPKLMNDFGFFYLKLGERAYFTGQNQKALNYFNKALSLINKSDNYNNRRPIIQERIARIYEKNDQLGLSLKHALEAIHESKIKKDNKTHYYYTRTANILALKRNKKLAYFYLDSAIYYSNQLYQKPPHIDKIFANKLAWAYYQLSDYKESLKYFQAIDKLINNQEAYGRIEYWDNANDMCNCYLKLNEYDKAEQILSSIYEEMHNKYAHVLKSNIQSDIKRLFKRVNLNYSRTLYHQYLLSKNKENLILAYKHLQQADQLVEQIRSGLRFDLDQMATGNSYFDYTQLGIEITTALHSEYPEAGYLEDAFRYSQKGKAYSLLLGVNDRKWKIRAGIPENIIQTENNIKGKLKFYQNEFELASRKVEPDNTILNHLNQYVDRYMQQFDSITHYIQVNYPKYYQLKYAAQHISSSTLKSRLGPKQVLVDYYLTKDKLYQYVFTNDQFRFYNSTIDSTFYNHLKVVTDEISEPFIGNKDLKQIREFTNSAHTLYNYLLSNISSLIKQKDLIIVPHADLAYLPFEVLLTDQYSQEKPIFRDFPWLINQNAISYAYNAALVPKYQTQKEHFNKVISFAPEYFGSQQLHDSTLLSIKRNINDNLLPLNAAKEEVEYINSLFNATAYMNETASKNNFIAKLGDNNILHLAMHSLIDNVQPLNSQLIFAANNDSNDILRAYELYNYNINSPLVVLSSCNTGSGRKRNGEGLISIARAFMYSGAQSQLMTLWPVNDVAGSELTKFFYKEIKSGLLKDHALQQAKLKYIQQSDAIRSHPFYWANYVLSGNAAALKQKKSPGMYTTLATFLLIIVSFWIYNNKRKSNF